MLNNLKYINFLVTTSYIKFIFHLLKIPSKLIELNLTGTLVFGYYWIYIWGSTVYLSTSSNLSLSSYVTSYNNIWNIFHTLPSRYNIDDNFLKTIYLYPGLLLKEFPSSSNSFNYVRATRGSISGKSLILFELENRC